MRTEKWTVNCDCIFYALIDQFWCLHKKKRMAGLSLLYFYIDYIHYLNTLYHPTYITYINVHTLYTHPTYIKTLHYVTCNTYIHYIIYIKLHILYYIYYIHNPYIYYICILPYIHEIHHRRTLYHKRYIILCNVCVVIYI